jgi:uncharacterized protein
MLSPMTGPASPPTDPGATPVVARALAPDLARGGMLLLIALANVHLWTYGHPLDIRGYPRELDTADQVITCVQMLLVDGRAYPLFGFLLGYGIVQLARRRTAVGLSDEAVTRVVCRRGGWMILIGLVHGLVLFSGDIVGAYGLLAVLLAGPLVRGTDHALLGTAAVGMLTIVLFAAGSGLPAGDSVVATLPSMTIENPVAALATRTQEWIGNGFFVQAISVLAAVTIGAWAARRRWLDEPERHRGVLTAVAIAGLAAAVLAGMPYALMASQLWAAPPLGVVLLASVLHSVGGYAGGVGYAALFGLLAVRLAAGTGPVTTALRSCGQRSLSCYLAQSVAFAMLLPAWTFGLGATLHVWQAALYALGTWLVILLVAAASAQANYRGPAELLLRRLTYGPPRSHRLA